MHVCRLDLKIHEFQPCKVMFKQLFHQFSRVFECYFLTSMSYILGTFLYYGIGPRPSLRNDNNALSVHSFREVQAIIIYMPG